jgi:PIN domain nuclease of toxin-antitoxin system
VNLLLDSHAFLWFIAGDDRLSGPARRAIEATGNLSLLSVASLWEIGIKASLGRLTLERPFLELVPRQMEVNGFELLPVEVVHISRVISLPFHHRDPFDRMLAAQCLTDDLTIVSRDATFDAYGVRRIW